MNTLDIIGLGLLAISLIGAGTGSFFAVREQLERKRARQPQPIKEMLDEEVRVAHEHVAEAVYIPAAPQSRRHNIHCPKCGRFSKRWHGLDYIMVCKVHDVQMRWVEGLVIPQNLVIEGATLHTQPIIVPAFVADIIHPVTEPIDILVPDDLAELDELGARI